MRILTFTSLFPDSTRPNFCIFIYQRMAHVARLPGNSVVVVAPVPYAPFWAPGKKAREYRAIPKLERFGDLQVYHPRYPFLPKISRLVHGFLMFIGSYWVVRRLAGKGVDCIDAHFVYPDGLAAVLLGKALRLPVIVSARGTDMNLTPNSLAARPMLRWTLQQARGLVGVCRALSDAMTEMGAPPDRVKTIGNGVDGERFYPIDRADARRRLGVPIDTAVVLSVGGLQPHKGQDLLIEAVVELRRGGLDLRLYLAGEGHLRGALEQQIDTLSLREQVTLLGNVANEELKYWYSAADVSCLASSREGWANVLLESMACGTPVVATRVWGTPEVIVSDDLGILVERSSEALASGMRDALQRRWDRDLIAAYAREHSWEAVAKEVEQWLSQRSHASPAAWQEQSGTAKIGG